jgi:hypothetical protein
MINKITLPSSWEEVKIGMYQDLASVENSDSGLTKLIDIISVLADIDPEDVRKINSTDLEPICDAIAWTADAPKDSFKEFIEVDGKVYHLVKLSSLSVAENADLETYANDIGQLHKFFALLYRPIDEKEYSVETMNERAELFRENVAITDVIGTIVFFLGIAVKYEESIQLYSKNQ